MRLTERVGLQKGICPHQLLEPLSVKPQKAIKKRKMLVQRPYLLPWGLQKDNSAGEAGNGVVPKNVSEVECLSQRVTQRLQ